MLRLPPLEFQTTKKKELLQLLFSSATRTRTGVYGVRGRCPRPLDDSTLWFFGRNRLQKYCFFFIYANILAKKCKKIAICRKKRPSWRDFWKCSAANETIMAMCSLEEKLTKMCILFKEKRARACICQKKAVTLQPVYMPTK